MTCGGQISKHMPEPKVPDLSGFQARGPRIYLRPLKVAFPSPDHPLQNLLRPIPLACSPLLIRLPNRSSHPWTPSKLQGSPTAGRI
jgi:hypothetical protein